jgi:gas vesicle protein
VHLHRHIAAIGLTLAVTNNNNDKQGENIMLKENQESKKHDKNILGVLGGVVIGGLAGSVTMLLMAPQSGKKTRMQIKQKTIELRDQTVEMFEDTMTQLRLESRKIAKGGRRKAKELMQQGQDLVVDQLDNVSDAAQAGKKAIQSS